MSATALLFTDYASAGGTRLGELVVVDGTHRERVDGDETTTLTVGKTRWNALGGDVRQVVRLVWPEGTVTERRIARIKTEHTSPVVELECEPVTADLGTGGPILRTVGGKIATRLAGELAVATALAQYVIPHSSAQRLGLVLGTIERNTVVPFELDAPTPLTLIRTLFDAARMELEVVRTSDTVWTLHGRAARGSTLDPLVIRDGRNQQQLMLGVDDKQLATVVVPLGSSDPGTGDRATIATSRFTVTNIASGWVSLRDPENTSRSPIVVDTQMVGTYLVSRSGVAQLITDSRTSDGSVFVASTAGLSIGSRVWFAADAAGTPLVEVYDSSAVGSRRRVVPLPVDGLRGEANELSDGRFVNGLAAWRGANQGASPSFTELARSVLGTTVTGAANGARAASTPTTTPLALKSLPATSWIRQGDELRIGGLTYTISSDVIASTTGTLALPISPALSGTYADNTAITLARRQTLTVALTTAVSPLDASLFFDANAANDFVTFSSSLASSSLSNATYATGAGLAGFTYLGTGNYMGALRVELRTAPGATGLDTIPLTWATKVTDVFTVTPTSFTFTDADNGTLNYSAAAGTVQIGLRVRVRMAGGFAIGRVTAFTGSTMTLAREGYFPFQVTSNATLTSVPTYASMALVSAGTTFTLNALRESRTLNLNGVHNSGATTLNTKAVTNISTRNWINGDSIRFEAALSATAVITASLYQGQDVDTPALTYYRLTYNAGTSTNLELWNPATDGNITVSFPAGAGYCTAYDIDKVNKYLFVSYMNDDPAQGVAVATGTATGTMKNTYTVNAGASWAATGLVTLSTSTGINTTRYAITRGMRVFSNFYANTPQLYVETASVTNGATSIQLRGEANADTAQPGYPVTGVLYRVLATASKIPFPGNVLYAAASAQVSAGGTVSVTPTAVNPNAIADNDVVTITRPALLRTTDPTTGSVARLLSPPGNNNIPLSTTPALEANDFVTIPVPAGQTVAVTALVTFALSAGSYPLGQMPGVALVDIGGNVLKWGRLADATAQATTTPTIARLIITTVLTSTTTIGLRLYGGTSDVTLWTVAIDAMVAVTDRDDVPFTLGSWANALLLRGAEELAVRRDPAVTVNVALATLRRWSDAPSGAPVGIGQTVRLPTYGLTRRVLTVDRSVIDPDRATVEVGVLTDELTTQVATLLSEL